MTTDGAGSKTEVPVAHPPASAADAAVIAALRGGDEEAFARLVDQHHGTLRRIARLYVANPAVAEEVVQETWLAVIQGVWAFQGRSALKTWILRILINRAKTRGQREGRTVPFADAARAEPGGESDPEGRGRLDPENARAAGLLDPGPSPEAALLSGEARAQLRAAIDALPPNQRMVITMRDLEGCSSEEVCNVLGLSETNQRVILHRARSGVRARLAAYFREE